MLFDSQLVRTEEFASRMGWHVEPEGLCRDDACVPLPLGALRDDLLDLPLIATALRMPVAHDAESRLWAVGPPAAEHALQSAHAPDLVLPDVHGQSFELASLRGRKVLLLAWASW